MYRSTPMDTIMKMEQVNEMALEIRKIISIKIDNKVLSKMDDFNQLMRITNQCYLNSVQMKKNKNKT